MVVLPRPFAPIATPARSGPDSMVTNPPSFLPPGPATAVIADDLSTVIAAALAAAGLPEPPLGVEVTPAKAREHGDWQTNVALSSPSRPASHAVPSPSAWSPRSRRHHPGTWSGSRSPGRGSSTSSWRRRGCTTSSGRPSRRGPAFGRGDRYAGLKVNLEFVSANPTGPLHAGGGRWVLVGDAIANLLAAQGATVHREYYLNDAGTQLDTFTASLMARYHGTELPEDGYQGEYLAEMAEELRAALGDDVTAEAARGLGLPGDRGRSARATSSASAWSSTRGSRSGRCTTRGDVAAVLDALRAGGYTYEQDGAEWLAQRGARRPARPGPRAEQRHHDVPRQRSRLPPRQAGARVGPPHRHLGRRPPRPGEVAPGRAARARHRDRRRARARDHPRSARDPGSKDGARRADLEADRQRDHARRHPRRGRSRRRAGSRSCSRASTPR